MTGQTDGGFPRVHLRDQSVSRFLDACLRDRVPPLLFIGQAGTGKEHTAIDFARLVCCRETPKCELKGPLCESCRKAVNLEHQGIHLIYPTPSKGSAEKMDDDEDDIGKILDVKRQDFFDTHVFAKKVSIRIARSRAMIHRAGTRPFGSDYDVFVVVSADLMREEAQNALLKLVEEPPGHCVIICLSENPDAILYTIRSRCQRVRFPPLKPALIETLLKDYYKVPGASASKVAGLSRGSIRRAREIMSNNDEEGRESAFEILSKLADAPRSWVIQSALTVSRGKSRDSVARFLHEFATAYRDVMVNDKGMYANPDRSRALDTQAARLDRKRVPAVLDRIQRAHDEILRRNLNVDAALVDLFLDIKHLGC